jgi:hypothetical protein
MRVHLAYLFVGAIVVACATNRPSTAVPATSAVRLTFAAESDAFSGSVREYDSLWTADGRRITQALESASRLRFADIGDTVIHAIVFEGPSESGYRALPMKMRASYPLATKQATLMHELGHRLQSHLFRKGEQDHPSLFLWLYSAWVDVYGEPFAGEQVAVEKRRGGVYPAAWDAALALSAVDRAARWDSVRTSRIR